MAVSSRKHCRLSKSKRRELRRRQARRARQARILLRRHYDHLPQHAQSFFETFSPVFRRATFLRFAILLLAGILPLGGPTGSTLLPTRASLAPRHPFSLSPFLTPTHLPLTPFT